MQGRGGDRLCRTKRLAIFQRRRCKNILCTRRKHSLKHSIMRTRSMVAMRARPLRWRIMLPNRQAKRPRRVEMAGLGGISARPNVSWRNLLECQSVQREPQLREPSTKFGSVQSSVSGLILDLPPKRAEAEASSENGSTIMLVGGAGFCWSGFERIIFFISQHTYQSFNSLSSLPSKNIAN